MKTNQTVTIDNKQVPIEDERNLLELIRKAGMEIPTFCYHSEMSIYGACRLCMVDVEGMGHDFLVLHAARRRAWW